MEIMCGVSRSGSRKSVLTGKLQDCRFYKTELNEFGRPMAVMFPVALHRLATEYKPTKLSESEWAKLTKENSDLIKREARYEQETKEARIKDNEKLRQAHRARENPNAALASEAKV